MTPSTAAEPTYPARVVHAHEFCYEQRQANANGSHEGRPMLLLCQHEYSKGQLGSQEGFYEDALNRRRRF